jgi:hypothetical protein
VNHYTMKPVNELEGMSFLREAFPYGQANELSFVLFSTSGVHGSYVTIEQCESREEGCDAVTFFYCQPRKVGVVWGNCVPKTKQDFAFLKDLRRTSWEALNEIGRERP